MGQAEPELIPVLGVRYSSARTTTEVVEYADVAQLVAHHLAKVRVASSNLVVRSEPHKGSATVEWPRGEATACKAVYTGSNPVSTSVLVRRNAQGDWRSGSALP